MVDERRIADEVLDYLVYAPVGALLTLVEDLPALANKGRSRVQGRLMVARSLGLFAVQIGQRRVQSVVKERVGSVRPGGKAPAPAGPAGDVEPEADTVDIGAKGAAARGGRPVGGTVSKPVVTRPPKHVPARGRGGRVGEEQVPAGTPLTVGAAKVSAAKAGPPAGAGRAAVSAASLAIPGYDSLAASQVVQRLGGLTLAELEAVGDYEAATRGRRTILGRISQLSNPAAGAVGAASDPRT